MALTLDGTEGVGFPLGGLLKDARVLLASDGYVKLPGGAILQWGSVSLTSAQQLDVTLPIPFPNAGLQGLAGSTNTGAGTVDQSAMNVVSLSTTTITIKNTAGATRTARWFAIGY